MPFRMLLVVGLLSHSVTGHSNEKTVPLDVAISRTNAIFDQFEALGRTIDVRSYDLGNTTDDLLSVSHPDEILDWVRSNIAFEAYPGLLRGPEGTLLSRAGNSLDQALLLGKLIRDAGFDARIVRSRLSAGDAWSLLTQMRSAATKSPVTDMTAFKSALEELITKYSTRPEDSADLLKLVRQIPDSFPIDQFEIDESVSRLSQSVVVQLAASGFGDGVEEDSALVEETRDYFWVQYRAAAQESWSAGHPAYAASLNEPKDVEVLETFDDSVPETLQHRVRIEVVLEQKLGEQAIETPIMPAWERPAANLVGIPLTYANQPDSLNVENLLEAGSYESAIEQTKFFMPVFNGSIPDGANFFGLDGFTAPADVAGSPYGALFATVGSKATSATTAISQLGGSASGKPVARLTGQYIRISVISPSGQIRKFERPVWREIEESENKSSQALSQLASRHTIMLAAGRYPAPYVMKRLLGWISSKRSEALALVRLTYDEDNLAPERNIDDAESWIGHLLAFSMFDIGADAMVDLTYRSAPNIAIYRESMNPLTTMPRTFDMVTNDRRAFVIDENSGRLTATKSHAIRIGIWESSSEGVALGSSTAHTSVSVIQHARNENIALLVAAADEREALDSVDITKSMRDTISSQLDDGYIVVVPERKPRGTERNAWLRVDPHTGNALGYLEGGIGGALEYSIMKQIAGGAAAALLCGAYLSVDQDGLTIRDAAQCVLFGAGAAMGGLSMVASAAQLEGASMAIAWIGVLYGVMGLAMDSLNSPGLDQPMF